MEREEPAQNSSFAALFLLLNLIGKTSFAWGFAPNPTIFWKKIDKSVGGECLSPKPPTLSSL